MKFETLYIEQLNHHYCTARELQYGSDYGQFLSIDELNRFYDYLENCPDDFCKSLKVINLKSFNSKRIFFSRCVELSQSLVSFIDLLKEDLETKESSLTIRNMTEIMRSRVYSELEGSLDIENVPTTRKRFDDLVLKDVKPVNTNDRIIKNMAKAIEYVLTKPSFNKENLYKLYNILSSESLDYDHRLKDGDYYRYDKVYIDEFEGCPVGKIEECMNSLFDYVNSNLNNKSYLMFYLPHIAHYYVLYIHPYFDYNGRTARMVSLWIYLLMNDQTYPPFISDAINQTKASYYYALSESRNARNDLTYFLKYVIDVSILYFLTYKNIEHIDNILKNSGVVLSNLDKDYIKRILVSFKGPFTYYDFGRWNHIQISKQGAFKILNRFVKYGILEEVETSNNKKLFNVNTKILLYQKNKQSI